MQAAIKVLHAQLGQHYQEGFLQEAETIALLKHPHIIRILDFGIDSAENAPYLIMDYAPHGTLRTCHPKGSIVPLTTVVVYIPQITQALQYAHEHHRIHRDLKPENLLVLKFRLPKFGPN
jgi:eukaryotic-like serine/threonine-protein kinase